MPKKPATNNPPAVDPAPTFVPNFTPRLLRIDAAAFYLSVTYNFMEELIRSKSIPSAMLGKRRVVDIRDLDAYAESAIKEQAA